MSLQWGQTHQVQSNLVFFSFTFFLNEKKLERSVLSADCCHLDKHEL